jgi:hypothetical protein
MVVVGTGMTVAYLATLRLLRSADLAAITTLLGRRFSRD